VLAATTLLRTSSCSRVGWRERATALTSAPRARSTVSTKARHSSCGAACGAGACGAGACGAGGAAAEQEPHLRSRSTCRLRSSRSGCVRLCFHLGTDRRLKFILSGKCLACVEKKDVKNSLLRKFLFLKIVKKRPSVVPLRARDCRVVANEERARAAGVGPRAERAQRVERVEAGGGGGRAGARARGGCAVLCAVLCERAAGRAYRECGVRAAARRVVGGRAGARAGSQASGQDGQLRRRRSDGR
jgi:hypothetical protein